MATFDHLRPCPVSEYNYYEEERLDLELLIQGGLYVAMHSLNKKIGGHGAVAVPMVIVELDGDSIKYRSVTGSKKPDKIVRELGIEEEDFIVARTILIEGIRCEKGYIRDHHTGLDGPEPDAEIQDEVPLEREILALAR